MADAVSRLTGAGLLAAVLAASGWGADRPTRQVETEPYLQARRDPPVVVVRGRVPAAAVRRAWARGAGESGAGEVIDLVEVTETVDDAPWASAVADRIAKWLGHLTEGSVLCRPGLLEIDGTCATPEDAALLERSARDGLPEGWDLRLNLTVEPVRNPVLRVRWEGDRVICEGRLPRSAWSACLARWIGEPAPEMPVEDRVEDLAGDSPVWMEGVSRCLRLVGAEVRGGSVGIDGGKLILRGKVADPVAKLRVGREAKAAVGETLLVENFLRVEPLEHPPPVLAVAKAPAPPMPRAPAMVPAPPPVRPGEFVVRVSGGKPQVSGESPADGVGDGIARLVAEHLLEGEFRLSGAGARIGGRPRSSGDRERLLAAVARLLPGTVRLEDLMSVPEDGATGWFTRNIFFNTGSTYIKPEHREHLREAVAALAEGGPGWTVLVKGHADPRGDPETNEILSRQRAQAVREGIVKSGVHPDRIEVVAVGASESRGGSGDYLWQQDRRVEVILVP